MIRYFIIKESGDMVLEEFPEIFDNELRGASFDVFAEALINTNGVHELVGEIVLGADAGFENYRGPDGDRRDGENGKDNPFGASEAGIKAQEEDIIVRNTF